MLNVRLYFATGFDVVNVPDGPSMLDDIQNGFYYEDVPGVDLNQRKGFGTIRIKRKYGSPLPFNTTTAGAVEQNYATLENVDYLKLTGDVESLSGVGNYTIGGVFYFVMGVTMIANDTAELTILEDVLTTAGGYRRLSFNSGILTRRSAMYASFFDKEKIQDEYMGCVFPMVQRYELVGNDSGTQTHNYVESTIDLTKLPSAKSLSDPTDPTVVVNVPTMDPITGSTEFRIQNKTTDQGGSPTQDYDSVVNPHGSKLYVNVSGNTVNQGIANARSLGLDKAILSQYQVPAAMVSHAMTADDNVVTGLKTKFIMNNTGLLWEPAQVAGPMTYNPLVTMLSRIGMIGASGDKIEFDAEQLVRRDGATGPVLRLEVIRVVDPRPEGRPYYRFFNINHTELGLADAKNSNERFLMYAVKGAKWQKLPLMFTEISGMDIIEQQFKNARYTEDRQFRGQSAQLAQNLASARINEIASYNRGAAIDDILRSGGIYDRIASNNLGFGGRLALAKNQEQAANIAGFLEATLTASHSAAMAATNAADIAQATNAGVYYQKRNEELYNYGVRTATYAPEVVQTGDIDFARDISKNAVLVYFLEPDQRDIERISKILKMFGEKVFDPISNKDNLVDMVGGYYFSYFRIQGAEVRDNFKIDDDTAHGVINGNYVNPRLSLSERENLKAQLEAGVRVWHIPPKTYENGYTDIANMYPVTP